MTSHIKIHGIPPRIQYVANGVLADYSFPFAIFQATDIQVYLDDVLQADTSYHVSFTTTEEGGLISFNFAPTDGTIITLVRHLDIERTTDFQEGGALRADTLNNEFDYQIACQQQIADSLNRSMVLPPYATDTNVDLTLPMPQAGKAIVWNSEGTNLENSTVSVNALESTLKGYKDSAETAATTATTKAGEAVSQATIATTQAGIATAKAQEATITLANTVNKDMDNLSDTGKEVIVRLGMPDYSSGISVPLPTPSAHFIAPSDGYYITCRLHNNFGDSLVINGDVSAYYTGNAGTGRDEFVTTVPLSKGDDIYWQNTSYVDRLYTSTFYPLKGAI